MSFGKQKNEHNSSYDSSINDGKSIDNKDNTNKSGRRKRMDRSNSNDVSS